MGLLLGEVSYCLLICISVCPFRLCYFWDCMVGAVRVAVHLMGFGLLEQIGVCSLEGVFVVFLCVKAGCGVL